MANDIMVKLSLLTLVGSAALIAVLLLRLPLRKLFGANVAYTAWGLVPIALCAALLPARLAPSTALRIPATAMNLQAAFPHAAAAGPDRFTIALCLWLLGAGASGLYFFHLHRAFMKKLGRLSERQDIHYAQAEECGPALIGIWRPRIVVPADFDTRYDESERQLIVAHERAHLQRADAAANLLCALLQCLFWFNPVLHFASRAFRFDQELACDATVMLYHPHSGKTYADAMLKTQLAASGSPAGCYWQLNHPLKERIMNLKYATPPVLNRIAGAFVVIALTVGGAFSAWAAQAPQTGAKVYLLTMELKDKFGTITPALQAREGEEAAVVHGEGDKRLRYSFIVHSLPTGMVNVELNTRVGEQLYSEPRLMLPLGGQPSTIETRVNPANDGDYKISLTITDVTPSQSPAQPAGK